ncbi:MAG: Cell division protein FtsL [Ignavibacteria bacterium]|nr:Cell division protein FtsL [Ignavibacteria bacterium]
MKKSSGKKISIFYFLICLVLTSIILVIYIGNIIHINETAVLNNTLKEEINRNMQVNSRLMVEIEQLSGFERISQLARDKFGISYKENSIDQNKNIVVREKLLKK